MRRLIVLPPEEAPGNGNVCSEYGGCPHRSRCSIGLGNEL